MSTFILLTFSCDYLLANPVSLDKEENKRTMQYRPDGEDFVSINGKNRYTRALYGSHTAFRIETSDRPIFATFGGGHKNIRFIYVVGQDTLRLEDTAYCEARYTPGRRSYRIHDPLLDQGEIRISVLASPDKEEGIWEIQATNLPKKGKLTAILSPCKAKKLFRNGDLGVDPADSFDPSDDLPPLTICPISFSKGKAYLQFANQNIKTLSLKKGTKYYNHAEQYRKELAGLVVINTPDPYFNTLGGALAMAADGIWDGKVWQHGAVGWRMPLSGWRAAYIGDVMGWHDRARTHFNNYAASQVTEVPPVYPHPRQDKKLNWARAEKSWGTQMYSDGYICRNPERNNQMHHYDMNLCYMDELMWHFLWTGDTAYVRTMWPTVERHLAWEKRNFDPNNDGLYDAYCCIWASDALYYTGGGVTHSSAYNYRGNKMAARLAELIGVDSEPYKKEAELILNAMNDRLWLTDRGYWAEYEEAMGHKRKRDNPAVWTIYHAIDSEVDTEMQAYQSTRYIDTAIPHIDVLSDDLEEKGLQTVATTNWLPYSWSINNVAFAEVMHTSLSYWQAGRNEEGFRLLKASILDGMYLGSSPGNFGQVSFYDAARGECYRDFGDPVGVASRALIQGLYGIYPDLLEGVVRIVPGFPTEWGHASLKTSYIDFNFLRQGMTDRYEVSLDFQRPAGLQLELRGLYEDALVRVNGQAVAPEWQEGVGYPKLVITLPQEEKYTIEVRWKGEPLDFTYQAEVSGKPGSQCNLSLSANHITKVEDPQGILAQAELTGNNLQSALVGTPGHRTLFLVKRQGKASWLQPVPVEIIKEKRAYIEPFLNLEAGRCEAVNIDAFLNDSVTNTFQPRYFSPRPATTTLQIPIQGIGEWCHPQLTAELDDTGLRQGSKEGLFTTENGIPLRTPAEGYNIAYTSLWDNFPDTMTIPLEGQASNAYLFLAGTTNHMQCHLVNGTITINYCDGTSEVLELINPENWCPMEQDFFVDGKAFSLEAPRPYRLHFKSGLLSNNLERDLRIKGVYGRPIDGGAGVVLDMPLNPEKELSSIRIETLSNDVLVGLMGITLQRVENR